MISSHFLFLLASVNTLFGSKIVCPTTGVLLNNRKSLQSHVPLPEKKLPFLTFLASFLHTEMDDFATPGRPNGFGLAPSESNFIKPGKQPLSSMSPTMVFRRHDGTVVLGERSLSSSTEGRLGEILLVLGASGGPKIITAVVQTLLNRVVMGMPLFEAVIQPRIHDQLVYNNAHVTAVERSKLGTGEAIRSSARTVNALRQRNHTLLPITYTGAVQAIAFDLETRTLSATSDVRKGGAPAGF
jgi:gamma-glutamyltranspeptidase / glutathione hydrolase